MRCAGTLHEGAPEVPRKVRGSLHRLPELRNKEYKSDKYGRRIPRTKARQGAGQRHERGRVADPRYVRAVRCRGRGEPPVHDRSSAARGPPGSIAKVTVSAPSAATTASPRPVDRRRPPPGLGTGSGPG